MLENVPKKSVRETANSEGPWSLYLFSRLENPAIRSQAIEMIFEALRGKRAKEDIAARYDAELQRIRSFTPVSFGSRPSRATGGPDGRHEVISLGAENPATGEPFTAAERHITEAHEKGHVVRWDFSSEIPDFQRKFYGRQEYVLSPKFSRAFDFSGAPRREIPKDMIAYLSSPHEAAERMSQLKNYFGFRGAEEFTKEHLDYARKHYVSDTGYDNGMTQFFRGITPEKEEAFLELINSAGI